MSKSGKQRSPYVRPVRSLQLPEINTKGRIILIILLVVIAAVALVIGFTSLLGEDSGWREVETTTKEVNCSGDFVLNYDFGYSGISATAESRQITELYNSVTVDAYQIFSTTVFEEQLFNLAYVNTHINQWITVDETLYRAFEQVTRYQNRSLYMAPVYVEYNRIFLCEDEEEAGWYDPAQNEELALYIADLTKFANNPDLIDLEMGEDNTVRLNVSDEYLSFAEEYSIDAFLDFGWMKNAFIIDYIAETLAENDFTNGYIASYDGFTRNLDARGQSYSVNLFDRLGNLIYRPAVMEYIDPMSIVFLRNYPMSDADRWHYFSFSNGRIATTFVNPETGVDQSSTDNIVAYSEEIGCAEVLLNVAQIFMAEELNEAALESLPQQHVDAIWFEDSALKCTQESVKLTATEDAKTAGYKIP